MEPRIGRSIVEGFRVTNSSWPAMGLYAAGWVLLGLAIIGILLATRVPSELFQPAEPGAVPAAQTAAPAADGAVEDAAAPAATPDDPRQRAAADWLVRSWPAVVFCILLGSIGGLWLYAGQIGYVVQRLRQGVAALAMFLSAPKQTIGALVAAWLLMLAIGLGAVVAVTLIGVLLSMLGRGALAPVAAILGALLVVAGLAAMIWLLVRLTFWFVAIVADRMGPIAGLRQSWELTKGRWWKTVGLGAVLILIALGAELALSLVSGLGGLVGGPVGAFLGFVTGLLRVLVGNVYLGFVSTAALLRFYEDAKAVGSSRPASP